MGKSLSSMNELVLQNCQRYNLKAPELTDRDRDRVDAVTIFEKVRGQYTIDRRITKEGKNANNNATTAS